MIKKITKTITQILKNEFNNINIYTSDIEAGYNLPCFFINYNDIKTEKLNSKIDTLYINLDVLYGCEDNQINQLECFEMVDKLRRLFLEKPIKIDDDISFHIFENQTNIESDFISISFDIEMNLIKDTEEDFDYIQNLIIN